MNVNTIYLACPTCLADNGGLAQQATNNGIFVMLGALFLVFGGIAAVVFSFVCRAKRLAKHA